MLDAEATMDRARAAGQGHLFRWWGALSDSQRSQLAEQVAAMDFDELARLIALAKQGGAKVGPLDDAEPVDYVALPATPAEKEAEQRARQTGEAALRAGRVAALVVAGGQGTRLGFDGPKGMFPIGPVTGKTLFELHAHKLIALAERYGASIPLYVMTSAATHEATVAYFEAHEFLGLGGGNVRFFRQGMVPIVDRQHRVILAEKGRIATSPNGHGGTLRALHDEGMLAEMAARGVDLIAYFQVDNPLVRSVDPAFIGYHLQADAEMSSKAMRKRDPQEKIGAFARVRGALCVIEYSDLTPGQMRERDGSGRLKYGLGSPAMHVISRTFAERFISAGRQLPYHIAEKRVPCVNEEGRHVKPGEPNGLKFETFIFDALRYTTRSVIMEIRRDDEFSPVKNDDGVDSAATARRDLSNQFGRWLEAAGVAVPRDAAGNVGVRLEIDPRFALDADELGRKVDAHLAIAGDLCLFDGTLSPSPCSRER